MIGHGARHGRMKQIDRPCPGTGTLDGSEPCSTANMIGARGPSAKRCAECIAVRNRRTSAKFQRELKIRRKQPDYVPEDRRTRKHIKLLAGEQTRVPVQRCLCCLGTPHLRDPERLDEYGNSVCLPGMARCRVCWEPWGPDIYYPSRNVLGSSAAMAAASGQPW